MSAEADPRLSDTPAARVAEQRARLDDVAAALARTVDPGAIAALIVDAACAGLGTPMCWVTAVTPDGDHVEVLHSAGYEADLVEAWRRVPLALDAPMTAAIREGQPSFYASAAERVRAHPLIGERGGPAPGTEATAVVPISIEGRTIGALGVSFGTARDLDADERWFLGALAAQVAQALERARLFAALREQDERLRFALQASGTGTWEWDIAEDRLSWSSAVHGLYGVPDGDAPVDLSGYLERIHPDDRERVAEAIRASVDTGASYDIEFRVLRPDGALQWNHGVGQVFTDATGRPHRMLGTTRDITDRKLAEAERDRFLEAERETARLRDAFIGVVSHELRTPITTIYGGTRVLARRWRELDPDARDEILRDVVEEADRLYRLAEDLLVLTRVERGTLEVGDEPVHLGRVVERVVGSERGRWPEVRFDVRMPPDLPSVQGEDTYVEQVLRNLLGNAAKYGGSGSTVIIEASDTPADVELRVVDEGPGFDEGEAELLFDLFYRSPTVARTHAGGGIGLFVCRQLASAMGGRIRAERRPGRGATFVMTLPRYADDDVG